MSREIDKEIISQILYDCVNEFDRRIEIGIGGHFTGEEIKAINKKYTDRILKAINVI